ncbi:MAG: hypothetical protein ACXW15_02155 [Acidimicrobiia bacterium]
MMALPLVLAHQGGWDEVLYVAVPALALLYALRKAELRARANAEAREAEQAAAEVPPKE